jgi:hypothetical protein
MAADEVAQPLNRDRVVWIHRDRAPEGLLRFVEGPQCHERAVEDHLQSVIDKAGRVDVSFNAIGIATPKVRAPLAELDVEQSPCRSRPTRGRTS